MINYTKEKCVSIIIYLIKKVNIRKSSAVIQINLLIKYWGKEVRLNWNSETRKEFYMLIFKIYTNELSQNTTIKKILKKIRNFGENSSCRKYADFSSIFFVFFFSFHLRQFLIVSLVNSMR